MKLKTKILLPLVSAPLILTTTLPICLMQTSCFSTGVPIAPDNFYWNSKTDYSGCPKGVFEVQGKAEVMYANKEEAEAALADPTKYSDNQVKWDIIMGYTNYYRKAGDTAGFTGKFKIFERVGGTVKYDIEINDPLLSSGSTTFHTAKDNYITSPIDFSPINNITNLGVRKEGLWIGDTFTTYTITINSGGESPYNPFDSGRSVFMFQKG